MNYGWEWDLQSLENNKLSSRNKINKHIKSTDISRVDLIIRWGGRRRLSGFYQYNQYILILYNRRLLARF